MAGISEPLSAPSMEELEARWSSAGRPTDKLMEPALEELVPPMTARNDDGRWSSVGRAGELIMELAPALALEVALVTARKRRRRPLGSKNNSKPPSSVGRAGELIMEPAPVPALEVAPAAMQTAVLEVALGCDVVSALAAFSRRHDVGVSVLSSGGAVGAVTPRQAAKATSAVTLRGLFEVLALYETMVPGWSDPAPASSVFLAGASERGISGTLAVEMTAADGGVSMVATIWSSAELHWLPATEEADARGVGRDQGWISGHPHRQVAFGNGADVAGLGGQQPVPTIAPMHPHHRF